jgi:hypothetical protein
MNEYADRIMYRALKRREQREKISLWMFLAFIYLVGLVTGWAITAVNGIK